SAAGPARAAAGSASRWTRPRSGRDGRRRRAAAAGRPRGRRTPAERRRGRGPSWALMRDRAAGRVKRRRSSALQRPQRARRFARMEAFHALIGPEDGSAEWWQLCVRAVILFAAGVAFVRIAGRRTFSQATAL